MSIRLRPPAALAACLAAALLLGSAVVPPAAVAAPGGVVAVAAACTRRNATLPLPMALGCLAVRDEHVGGYVRAKFGKGWIDADHDGQNTRAEVLIAESTRRVTFNARRTTVVSGRWYSLYDDQWQSQASDVDIDHVVALAEVWRSGGWSWSASRRLRYANDLGVAFTLRAVTDIENRIKSDDDPTNWLPPHEPATCQYLVDWVAVKIRWKLAVDALERASIIDGWNSAGCAALAAAPRVRVVPAP